MLELNLNCITAKPVVEIDSFSQQSARCVHDEVICPAGLLRWRSSFGEVSPTVFIPIAETSSIIVDIGRWVFLHLLNY